MLEIPVLESCMLPQMTSNGWDARVRRLWWIRSVDRCHVVHSNMLLNLLARKH